MIAGAGLTTPIAYRWKTQVNENAKMPAYALELPEMDHNEIVGWGSAGEFGRFSAVFLDDADTHPRVKERIDVTARLIAPGAAGVHRVESRGQRHDRAAHRARAGRASRRSRPHDPSASSRSCCSATSCRSTSPRCAASTPSRSRSSTA